MSALPPKRTFVVQCDVRFVPEADIALDMLGRGPRSREPYRAAAMKSSDEFPLWVKR